MTQNQINFAKLQEDKRHNLVTEGYTGLELNETSRHNKASEGISWYSAGEAHRHNVESENLNWYVGEGQRQSLFAKAALDVVQQQILQRKQDLEEKQFEQQVWKDVRQVANDIRKLDINEMDAETRRQSMLNEFDDMLARYNLSVEEYVRSGYYRDMAAAFRDFSNGARSSSELITNLINSMGRFLLAQGAPSAIPTR